MTKKPENQALKVLKKFGDFKAPIDVEMIAEELGMKVNYEPLDADVSGVMLFKDGIAKVALNQDQHEHRQRFTLAHEIGHLSLHAQEGKVFVDQRFFRNSFSQTGLNQEECEANAFAASLLMPEGLISDYLEGEDHLTDLQVFQIAGKFKVSEQAMTLRLAKLGYIEWD